ncbi:hypothetical protein NBRC13296_05745 [Paenibacillus chitinolyticus]|uniref:hypothetical protein n=1 Tax=Paenibacillus chitinolyticus TaxID=79263 RepID=UPI003556C8F9
MYLDIVIIDYLSLEGEITNYKILPMGNGMIVIDRLADVHRSRETRKKTVGGACIYNSKDCSIEEYNTKIRKFTLDPMHNLITFQFEHKGVPVGPGMEAHGGIWNLILPPRWRLRELFITDPYDKCIEQLELKKQFRYEAYWDSECETQLVEMELRSRRRSFSFIVSGTASLIDTDIESMQYIKSLETPYGVTRIGDVMILDSGGRDKLMENIEKRIDWLELKPNLNGLGVNFNQIIKDSITSFKKKRTK